MNTGLMLASACGAQDGCSLQYAFSSWSPAAKITGIVIVLAITLSFVIRKLFS